MFNNSPIEYRTDFKLVQFVACLDMLKISEKVSFGNKEKELPYGKKILAVKSLANLAN